MCPVAADLFELGDNVQTVEYSIFNELVEALGDVFGHSVLLFGEGLFVLFDSFDMLGVLFLPLLVEEF